MRKKISPLEFLESIYLDEELPLITRMKAACEAAPYVHPKLSAMATTALNGNDFASLLERAIARSDLTPENIRTVGRLQIINGTKNK